MYKDDSLTLLTDSQINMMQVCFWPRYYNRPFSESFISNQLRLNSLLCSQVWNVLSTILRKSDFLEADIAYLKLGYPEDFLDPICTT